ncbi:bifunctional metallophosphatase/5'-nucleotidase [Kaarinaea lacus]
MQLGDTHGHMHSHAEIFPDGRIDPHSGGLAKLTTLINEVRADNPNNLLLAIGDTTHGSGEMLFSSGELIMPWLNYIGIDVFTPGNWDFAWGPRIYKQRFVAGDTSTVLAPNNRTTVAWMYHDDPGNGKQCNVAGGLNVTTYATCHLIKANFDTVAMNVYNFNEALGATNPNQPLGSLVHEPYKIKVVDGVKIAVLGLTSDVVPQQAQAFNSGFRFTMGYKEIPANIAAAKAKGATIIVVLSELGFAKNIQLVKEFPEINIMFSGHTHERTPEEIVITHADGSYSLVTESGEDSFLGRLDLKVSGSGKIIGYTWNLIEADSTVAEDETVEAMVDDALSTFYDKLPNGNPNPDFQCHTFGTNAFPYGLGHTNCDSFDKVVGHTDLTIQRWNSLEDVSNNVMVDAFLDLAESIGELDSKNRPLSEANTLSTTNGFRFDIVIPGSDDGFSGDITVGDLYDYYPFAAGVALAEFTGGRLKQHWEGVLSNVFDPNPYRQRGGWFLGFTHNMHFDIRLNDDFPRTVSEGKRIAKVTIDDGTGVRAPSCLGTPCAGANWDEGNPKKFDDSETYTLASCYPHGNPIDEVCRTTGATNVRFPIGAREKAGTDTPCDSDNPCDMFGKRQLDVNSIDHTVPPANSKDIFDPVRFSKGGPLFLPVAPYDYVHPVDALKRYLASHDVTAADHGLGRVNSLDGVPVSEHGGSVIVQPSQGAGPEWMKREFVTIDTQNQQ